MARIAHQTSSGAASTSVRVTTGSVSASGTPTVVVTLPVSMVDTNYTVSVAVEDSNGDLRVSCVTARTATTVTVKVQNVNAISARTGTLHVRAVHD